MKLSKNRHQLYSWVSFYLGVFNVFVYLGLALGGIAPFYLDFPIEVLSVFMLNYTILGSYTMLMHRMVYAGVLVYNRKDAWIQYIGMHLGYISLTVLYYEYK